MDIKTIAIILSICGTVISGCTSLSSNKLLDAKTTPDGLTYRLPAKQFTVSATYEITDCKQKGTDAELDARVSATITESVIGAEAYTIDYQQLNTLTKVTNTEFQLSEAGLLTGVNASIEDKSGAIISNTVSAAASIARGVAFPGISALDGISFKLRAQGLMDRLAKRDADTLKTPKDVEWLLANGLILLPPFFPIPAAALSRPPAVADLKVVKQTLLRYEKGEVAHIENVLKGESKQRVHRRKDVREETMQLLL